jgi:predicted Ser/Thr protein kinase
MSEDHFLNLQPGTIVNGRYEVVKCLGTGSMGMVYACRHRELAGHLVAMKVLFAEVARDTVAAARFRNEIVASYGVSHPNVVRAYEYFRDGDLVAFTMEYIGSGDLADRISHDEPLSIEEIIKMLGQMCAGVQAIHDAGIIHRDLKPENILITTEGDIKITDFGIARTGTGPKLTEHGGVVGTIDYVSPEYLERGQVDTRSDIYALGVLAYEMITGESPFRGNSVIETMTIRLRSDPEAPSMLRRECPRALDKIILKAMTRDPEKRYQKASEMLSDLQELSGVKLPVVEKETVSAVAAQGGAAMHAQVEQAVYDERFTGTVALEPDTIREIRSSQGMLTEEESDYDEVEHLESVLSARGSFREEAIAKQDVEHPSPSVAVAHGHLSPERMKQLSLNLHPESRGRLQTLIWVFVILAVCIGLLGVALRYIEPGLFGLDSRPEWPSILR